MKPLPGCTSPILKLRKGEAQRGGNAAIQRPAWNSHLGLTQALGFFRWILRLDCVADNSGILTYAYTKLLI